MRKHQFGRQSALNTPVAAVKAYPFSGVPSVDLGWTDREIDVGSIDPVAAPLRGAGDLTASLSDPGVEYNSLPLMFAAIFGGSVDPTTPGDGTAKAWSWAPASETVDEPDVFTYEFGDDVTTDWYQLGDGLLESLELAGPEGLGPFTASMTWRFGSMNSSGSTDEPDSPAVPTSLDVDPDGAILYLKDLGIYIASSVAGLAAGQVTDALHAVTLRISGDLDQKRFANGDQSFDIDAYGRATRLIEVELMFAKTSDTVGIGSESDAWMSDSAVTRYIELKATSLVKIEPEDPDIFYSMDLIMPLRYYTREEGDSGGNTVVTLTGHAFFDADDLEGVFTADVVCTQATL
jgi:hypothetical protein